MERSDNINMGGMPILPNMNTTGSTVVPASMLGLDMQLNSHAHHPTHLQFQPTNNHGPLRHHTSPSPSPSTYSPYGASIARARQQVTPIALHVQDADDSDASKRSGSAGPAVQQACPWGRMKWTEGMVRLLIAEVYRVGDDGGGGGTDFNGNDHHAVLVSAKGANRANGGVAKGKWKSVSKGMMDKGFSVSPQQCEDKFNDLNKRYKRVLDLLGKGTACRVVENPTLLDSMDHLSAKSKEEARKLLSSKHLFFPEMCAYHNASAQPCTGTSSQHPSNSPQLNVQSDQQQCLHHQPAGGTEPARYQQANHHQKENNYGPAAAAAAAGSSDDDDDNNNNMSDDESDDSSNKEGGEYDSDSYHGGGGEGNGTVKKQRRNSKRAMNSPPLSLSLSSTSGGSPTAQQLKNELAGVMANGGGEGARQWMKRRSTELEEQRVNYQCRSYQLEKQRFKWLRYSNNKEREMEKMRLQNDRLKLENERMLLLIRHKEIESCGFGNTGTATGAAAASSTEQLQMQQQQYIQK